MTKPLLFVSHRHKNDAVAKVLYDFLRQRALGRVELFMSSRAEAALAPGSGLKAGLGEKLSKASAVALVYTTSDEDWSYCMWECGLATDPSTPSTRIIVFQCTDDIPRVYADAVRVNVHDQENVKAFVIAFLTDPEFFPGHGSALATDFTDSCPEVDAIAADLGEKLREAAPPPSTKPDDEWPSFDALTLEMPIAVVRALREEGLETREASNLIQQQAVVRWADKFCPQLFGMPSIQLGTPLAGLFQSWKTINQRESEDWISELLRQIREAAAWRFPKIRPVRMGSRDRTDKYIPAVHRVKKLPAKGTVRFFI